MGQSIEIIGVVGAGQMGRGIAQVAAQTGYRVILVDNQQGALEQGLGFIQKMLSKAVEKSKISSSDADQALARIETTTELKGLRTCQLIIEAATENKPVKFEIFKQLDAVAAPDTILATNTSSISITEIAAQTKRPELVAGMHFMNPVPIMKLVEGIKGLETSENTFTQVRAVAEKMGKVFVSVKDSPGFVINRILIPMINEAAYTLYEGLATVEDIDQAMKLGTNQPMGPLQLADFIGLDTCLAIMDVLYEGFADSKYRACPLLKQYVTAGRLGRKSGRGFYEY